MERGGCADTDFTRGSTRQNRFCDETNFAASFPCFSVSRSAAFHF